MREEGHPRLTGDGARQQGLAGARRAVEQHALGDARPQLLELLRVLEELLDLLQLLDRLVDAGDVLEGHLGRVDADALGAALAEAHDLGAAALHAAHHEDHEADDEHDRQQERQRARPPRRAEALGDDLHGRVLGQELRELCRVGVVDRVRLDVGVGGRHLDRLVLGVDDDRRDVVVAQVVEEASAATLIGVALRAATAVPPEGHLRDDRQDDDERDEEDGAPAESAHGRIFEARSLIVAMATTAKPKRGLPWLQSAAELFWSSSAPTPN